MVDTYETLGPLDAWLRTVHVEPAGPQDREAVLAMVRRHEGEASARIAEHWWRRQPEAFATFRGPPVRRPARPRPAGEELVHRRFWMGADSYQGPGSARNLLAATGTLEWLTNPRLAWSFLTVADPDAWHPVMTYLNQRRAAEADFEVGGRHYAVYAHDWRAEPPLAWLDRMAERELSDQTASSTRPASSATSPTRSCAGSASGRPARSSASTGRPRRSRWPSGAPATPASATSPSPSRRWPS